MKERYKYIYNIANFLYFNFNNFLKEEFLLKINKKLKVWYLKYANQVPELIDQDLIYIKHAKIDYLEKLLFNASIIQTLNNLNKNLKAVIKLLIKW